MRAAMKGFAADHRGAMASDHDGEPVFMAKDDWELGYVEPAQPGDPLHRDQGAGVRECVISP